MLGVITFKYDVRLDQTMAFESVYHENLRYDFEEKQELRATRGALFVWMFIGEELAGESYGIPLANLDEPIEGLTELTDTEKRAGIYCYSNTILPSFQKQGFGKILKAHWLGVVAGKGFELVYGHARPGGSQALNVQFGAALLGVFPNWYDTGEDYRMYRLVLDSV
ncbi:MAG: hypothetical protein LAO76_18440 [Acidobacteriia bacterium]|nr:hypothetical protein [Terriglobia bacterium]